MTNRNVKKVVRTSRTPDNGTKRTNDPKRTTPSIPDPPSYSGGYLDGGTNIKVPTKNVLDLTETGLNEEELADLMFHEIGGIELANMLSFGTVRGINQKFNVITNLDDWQRSYNPTRLLSEQAPGSGGVQEFSINLFDKLVEFDDVVRIERDSETNSVLNLVIELENIAADEELELQVIVAGQILEIS